MIALYIYIYKSLSSFRNRYVRMMFTPFPIRHAQNTVRELRIFNWFLHTSRTRAWLRTILWPHYTKCVLFLYFPLDLPSIYILIHTGGNPLKLSERIVCCNWWLTCIWTQVLGRPAVDCFFLIFGVFDLGWSQQRGSWFVMQIINSQGMMRCCM